MINESGCSVAEVQDRLERRRTCLVCPCVCVCLVARGVIAVDARLFLISLLFFFFSLSMGAARSSGRGCTTEAGVGDKGGGGLRLADGRLF